MTTKAKNAAVSVTEPKWRSKRRLAWTAVRQLATACSMVARAAPSTLAFYAALTLGAGAMPVAIAWQTKLLLDALIRHGTLGMLIWLCTGLAAIGMVAAILPHLTQYLRAELDRRVGVLAQDRLFIALEGLIGLARFENPAFLDRVRLAQQAGGASPSKVTDGILSVARAGLTISGFLGTLFLIKPLMAPLVLLAGIPTLIAEISLSRRRARMFWDIGPAERRELFYSDLLSSVAAAKEIRLFGIGSFLRERMLIERRGTNAAKRAVDRREVGIQASLGLLAALVSGGGLFWAVNAARTGALSIGDITVFIAAVAGVQAALSTLTGEIARANQARLLFDHYIAVTTAETDLPVVSSPGAATKFEKGIELRDVWFRYSEDHPWVLRGVNLQLPRGNAIALVGLNGAGKSTLVKLLCRFYDPSHGEILCDGVDLRDIDPAEWRHRIGAVFQDYMQYDLTAEENIALGDLSALNDYSRIRTAAERAGIHGPLAELPYGYGTMLSRTFFHETDHGNPQAGVMLSGGQWQRLALARAFLRDEYDLMILDEPSAGLDAEAEHQIHTSLSRHRKGRTSLLISHRLAAVRAADRIVVLSAGQIIEDGDHDTLMAVGGEYARLFTLQASGYQLDSRIEPELSGGL